MNLWIDDSKEAPDGWAVAKNAADAIRLLRGWCYHTVALDHDLGEGPTGYDILRMIVEGKVRKPAAVRCISWNPVGRKRIEDLARSAGLLVP